MGNPLIFDIETGPETESTLELFEPDFAAPSNWKDPAKIEAKVNEQRDVWRERAALDATTGCVLAIGISDADGTKILHIQECGSEAEMIRQFWRIACPTGAWRTLIGFNSNRFDLPFLVRRGYRFGTPPPTPLLKGKYLHPCFIDLMDLWRCGDYQATISLDRLAKHLGIPAKSGSGAEFASLYASDQKAALAYLEHDLAVTKSAAALMGVITLDNDY